MRFRYFMLGYSFSSLVIVGYLGYHGWRAYIKVKPAIKSYQEGSPFSEKQKKDMVETLAKLAVFGEMVHKPEISTQTYLSAAVVLSENKDSDNIIKAKYFYIRSIETGLEYAHQTADYEKLLDAKLSYGVFLHNRGQPKEAVTVFDDALDLGKRMAPDSAVFKRIKNTKSMLTPMSKKTR